MAKFTYATRRSALALAQCRAFVQRLREAHPGVEFEELQVVTSGDRIQDRPLSEVGGKGLFVKEIEEALLEKRADFAVHSIKDVPGVLPEGLGIVCIPKREDPRDALISIQYGGLEALPPGARVGTSSLRRSVALKALRPDLTILPLRGNVDTRLRKLEEGHYDAIVLARAGLVRLGLQERTTALLDPTQCLPAVGQGALGIEARAGDDAVAALLAPMQDAETALCVAAERGVMVALEGDCRTPIGAFAQRGHQGTGEPLLVLKAFVAAPDGTRHRSGERTMPWTQDTTQATRLGVELGNALGKS